MTKRIGDFLLERRHERVSGAGSDLFQKAGNDRFFGDIALDLNYIKDEAIKRYVNYLRKQKDE